VEGTCAIMNSTAPNNPEKEIFEQAFELPAGAASP
jgi:hypothetical protein